MTTWTVTAGVVMISAVMMLCLRTMQDCGKPYYLQNYLAFFEALRAVHPRLRLIANCDMGGSAPTDLYDWHLYTGPPSAQHAVPKGH